MPIIYPDILHDAFPPVRFSYGEKDAILYALGIGMGADPLNPHERRFVYERDLKLVPTAVSVLSRVTLWPFFDSIPADPDRPSEMDIASSLYADFKAEFLRPLPSAGTFTAERRNIGAFDKGAGKGAILITQMVWTDDAGEEAVRITSSVFGRNAGGFGGPRSGGSPAAARPSRPADVSPDIPTRPDQSVLYRLSGDLNPLHIDPEVAREAGFPRPILHGLCTYGIALRAILMAIVDYDVDRILSHQLRWSSPVYPGDMLTVHLWRDEDRVSFEIKCKDRGTVVVTNGLTVLR